MASASASDEPGLADAVLLAPLSEDSFLHNLHARYKQDVIYTWVGDALVSVNPCRALPLYSADLVRAYLTRPPYTLPPHVYAVAAAAYRWVRDVGSAQCVVMTGESGAGKTEAARVCLQCVVLAGGGAGGGGAGGRLTAAGTLLEAFGNAATQRNHNASRFGKLLDVELDFKGEPVGGHITHFLLEKERACGAGVGAGERSFHVLYQLLAGADVPLLKRLRLVRAWQHYRVLSGEDGGGAGPGGAEGRGSPSPKPPRVDPRAADADKDHFAFTKAALCALGFCASERGALLRILAFVLKMGNVRFEPAPRIDGSLGARVLHAHELEEACALVGVAADELAAALGAGEGPAVGGDADGDDTSSGSEGGGDGDGDGDVAWCAARRDRLLSALYGRLFAWLVAGANARLRPPPSAGASAAARTRTISLLDVYGLEALQHNSLERLLINYAAERVQACVTRATLRHEQDEYVREGLPWVALHVPDHDAVAELLDAGADSVLGALRECSVRRLDDRAFVQRLQRRQHPRLRVLPPHHFQVVHFGGAVVYNAAGMVAKNRDVVCRRTALVLSRAREPLLRQLFAAPAPAASPHSGRRASCGSPRHGAASLACRQRALLGALSRRVESRPPRLVRCLRADAQLRPHRFDAQLVRHQLHSQGIVEMALLRRAGWCESMSARDVLLRYGPLRGGARVEGGAGPLGACAGAGGGDVRAARALLRALPIPSAEFAFGRSRVFVRSPRSVWELEALRAQRVDALVATLQRAWRAHRTRRREKAQRVVARAWRAWAARRRGESAGTGRADGSARDAAWAAAVVWRVWAFAARRRYLLGLWRRLPPRHRSPACAAWPPCPHPRLLGAADAHLRRLHHRWRCLVFRRAFDQTQRNRMREKVTASVLFLGRKALYARSVAHPFVGDYVRLRASGAWRRGAGGPQQPDRYVVFADVVRKVRQSGLPRRLLAVLSTHALLLLDPRSLRLRRRVPAHSVYRLSLSPFADDLLLVRVRAGGALDGSVEELSVCSSREAASASAAGCLFGDGGPGGAGGGPGGRRRGDVLLRTVHVLELATKLFLVVQNAVGAPPHVEISPIFDADLGGQPVTVVFHPSAGAAAVGAGAEPQDARLLRRGSHLDVLL